MSRTMNRRNWLGSVGGTLAAGGLLGSAGCATSESSRGSTQLPATSFNYYFGDLHNHGEMGYARGGLLRSFEIAAEHLDFFCYTPHSHWHDMPIMEQDKHMKWVNGFRETARRWPELVELNRRFHDPGRLVTFHGYEWHSSAHGDFCIIYPGDETELTHFGDLTGLQDYAHGQGALLIPHHPGYLQGRRGAAPAGWDPRVTRHLEIYSEHGNAEMDEGPLDYIRHSMGGRSTPNTLQSVLAAGHRVAVLASTDDHLGYPGAYGEGLSVILAPELTRSSLFEALADRRCYGVTGDRIRLAFFVNGELMGRELPFSAERNISVRVEGWDAVDSVEVLRNNEVIHRDHPVDNTSSGSVWDEPVIVRLEYGWGPWAALEMARICDWLMDVSLSGGRIVEMHPGFQSGPLAEDRRNRISQMTDTGFALESYTSRRQAFMERPTNMVVMKVRGGPDTEITVNVRKPSAVRVTRKLSELMESNEVVFTGPFPDESFILHRAVPAAKATTEFSFRDTGDGSATDWYYVRVTQRNQQMAWSSPVWVERKA